MADSILSTSEIVLSYRENRSTLKGQKSNVKDNLLVISSLKTTEKHITRICFQSETFIASTA